MEPTPRRLDGKALYGRLQEIQVVRVLWDNCFLEPSEDRVLRPLQKGNHSLDSLVLQPGHKELSQGRPREFHVRDAVAVNTSQEAADKTRQLCVLEHGEDPGVMDAGIGSSKLCQWDT